MPQQAKIADKMAIVRSINHESNSHDHSMHLSKTGHMGSGAKEIQNPCVGSVVAKVRGPNVSDLPPYVSVPRIGTFSKAAYLGNAYDPFVVGNPQAPGFKVKDLAALEAVTTARLENRRDLLAKLDATQRLADHGGVAEAMDQFSHQALEMITGDRARHAFDITQEDSQVRALYGDNSIGQSMLLARRLVEAGVTFVTVCVSGWDDHNKIAERMGERGPRYDRGVAALVNDLYARGLDRDVLVVSMGEFGRTPHINKDAGRDHWGALMSVLLAGGGLRVGQVVGSSDSKGQIPTSAPYRPENVFAMVYRHLGIDPAQKFNDFTGRPRHILDTRGLIHELI